MLCESRAANKFGHREEMELLRIDNAVPFTSGGGARLEGWMSLSLSL